MENIFQLLKHSSFAASNKLNEFKKGLIRLRNDKNGYQRFADLIYKNRNYIQSRRWIGRNDEAGKIRYFKYLTKRCYIP